MAAASGEGPAPETVDEEDDGLLHRGKSEPASGPGERFQHAGKHVGEARPAGIDGR
jgi:hypothetical protein